MCRKGSEVSVENFVKANDEFLCAEGLIEERAEGRRLGINYSEILTKLMHEATNCKRFASDLFTDWQDLLERLKKIESKEDFSALFSFRENGVDSAKSTIIKANAGYCMAEEYSSIYKLDVSVGEQNQYKEQSVRMQLYKVQLLREGV